MSALASGEGDVVALISDYDEIRGGLIYLPAASCHKMNAHYSAYYTAAAGSRTAVYFQGEVSLYGLLRYVDAAHHTVTVATTNFNPENHHHEPLITRPRARGRSEAVRSSTRISLLHLSMQLPAQSPAIILIYLYYQHVVPLSLIHI